MGLLLKTRGTLFALLVALSALLALSRAAHSESAVTIDPPKFDALVSAQAGPQTAIVAGGCFWGIQAVYQHTKGVIRAASGYAGGGKDDANYAAVSTARTGHAEAVEVTFDPRVISYGRILQIFFAVAHDPTQLDKQGPDRGPQYRSEIFPLSIQQRRIAIDYIAQLEAAKAFPQPIVTKVGTMGTAFYPAEAAHQDYVQRHPTDPYVVANDAPKIENLKRLFPDLYREQPALIGAKE